MGEEIESLYALLGIKLDDASVNDTVGKLIKAVQSKLNSSIYGGENGVITLPATLEGKFKNGKEINQEIKDAYAAIYKKAQQMADESVSLTLKDIEDFKAQIDKFGRKTAKYKGNDIIANANNNLRQTLSDYQNFVNDLRKEVNAQQKAQIKQTQKAKAQQKAKTQQKGETAYDDYLNKQEKYSRQAQGAKERKELFQELDEVRENKSPVKSSGNIRASSTNDYLMRLSEYSAHGSRWANELARTLKEEVAKSAKTLVTYIDPSYKKRTENGRATTEREFLNDTIKAAKKQLKNSIAQLEAGSEDITLDTLKEQAAVIKVLNKALGRTTEQAEKIITSAIENRYNGSTEVTQGRGKYKYDKTIQTKVGGTNLEEGQIKGAGPGHDNTQKLVKELYTAMHQWDAEVIADTIAKEMILGNEKTINKIENNRKRKSTTSQSDNEIMNVKTTPDYKTELAQLNGRTNEVFDAVRRTNSLTQTQTVYDKNANVKQDTDAAKEIKIEQQNADINRDTAGTVKRDESTGFNTNERADIVIDLLRQILSAISGNAKQSDFLTLPPAQEMKKVQETAREAFKNALKSGASYEEAQQKAADVSNKNKQKNTKSNEPITNGPVPPKRLTGFVLPSPEPEPYKNKVDKSHIYASPIKTTVWDTLAKAFEHLTGATKEYEATMRADAEEQDRMAAERIKTWGMNNGRNPNDTGDIAGMRRILQLYRTNKSSIEQNSELRQKIKLTEGREVDTTKITKALSKVLSGPQMRKAQMGGSIPRQILGAFTGFVGMPSIEKSRAQADGLNQVLGNINRALQSVLSDIQRNETELAGMEKTGQVQFDDQGYITKGSSAAYKTLADLEEHKVVLDSILADMNMVDQVVDQTDGKFTKLVRRLSFTSPVLRENNDILRNINAGLDKSGKALKFQTRMAEILNYTFQLIGRSIGQWFKRIISMLNPLNIIKNITGWIKSAFQDFGSYDTKWQRTMNVIKINFQRAIKPAMEWIAQKLVNIIGFFNIISMKVQEAFGQVPVDLFDQAGANAEKMRRELEKAANVTAGFDELHDIGSDNSGENDLLGDIYKPQLSDEWKAMAEEIGDLLAGLIKGEKTVGEVFGRIFEMLLDLLGKIAKAIWDWFKQTSLGKWITEHWKGLLATLLALFLGWQLLKIFGPTLLNTMGGAFKTLIGKVGGWLTTALGSTKVGTAMLSFGSGMVEALKGALTGKAGFLTTMKSIFVGHDAITAFGAWGETLGGLFVQSLGIALGGAAVAKGFDIVADDASYNMGLMESGGKKEDQKSGAGGKVLGAIGGAAIGAFLVGGPLAIGIGAIAGLIVTSLAPAFEELAVKAKDANNEMQKIEYYEGQVQGATTQVNIFDEQLNLLKQSLDLSTQSVYDQGEKLGISKTRMDELVKATQDGTFTTDMLTGSEQGLAGSLTDLAQKQEHVTEVSGKLEEAQKKLLKAQTDLSIAQDVEAGNFELAAARIEVAEAQGVYATEEATAKRIQLYKQGGDEERKNLLQNLTPEQRTLMAQYNGVTDKETKELVKIWQESGNDIREAFLSGTDESVQREFENNMNSMDNIVKQHQSFWQKAGDTIAEIFSFGNATTWTYNAQAKYEEEKKKGKFSFQSYDIGTNYVPNDGLAYLHQGEAVIPKKYNQPYQPQNNSGMESAINNLVQQVAQISNQVNQGIPVKGQFVQRGSDLVATVERANNRIKNNVLNNRVYAR